MEDRLQRIVGTLLKGTQEKKLNWEPTERSDEYVLRLENSGVAVDKWSAQNGKPDESQNSADITFLSRTGEVIEKFVASESTEPRDYRSLAELHDAARRNHLRVDEKLDDILGEIEKKVGVMTGF